LAYCSQRYCQDIEKCWSGTNARDKIDLTEICTEVDSKYGKTTRGLYQSIDCDLEQWLAEYR